MRISNQFNHQPHFKELLCTTTGLNETGRRLADEIEDAFSYSKEVEELDKKGIDVIIYPYENGQHNKVKVSIIGADNKLYKYYGKDHVASTNIMTGHNKDGSFRWEPDSNIFEVNDYMNDVLNGTAEQTTRVTKSLKEILTHFPIRKNWLDTLFK